MALRHAESGERLDVRPFEQQISTQKTTALFKSVDLEVIRLVLLAGKALAPHKVPGEITIQCLEGRLVVQADGEQNALDAGELLFLAGDVVHSVLAVSDSSALVTIALKHAP